MRLTRRSLLLVGAPVGGAAMAGRARADEQPAAVRGVRVLPFEQFAQLTIALDRQVAFRTFFLDHPYRFVIDLANARMPHGAYGQGPGASFVRRYRYAPRSGGAMRLVLDLDSPASLAGQQFASLHTPDLSFDLAPAAAIAAPRWDGPGDDPARDWTVVVDPGHGGRDPGAIGATGVREKDVVLDAALQLRRALEARGNYRVALTREADSYVELADRVRFARAQNADLFLSIHADSHPNSETRGASVYTISEHGEDRAQNMMGAQNWDLNLGEAPHRGVAHDILIDLYQRETTNCSAQFAQMLIPRLRQVTPLLRNTHRSAGFFVLLTPDVPAVLIETGFLSNVTDERRLSDPHARQALAGAMAEAVEAYFAAPIVHARA